MQAKKVGPKADRVTDARREGGEGLVVKLKLHYFGHLMQRTESLEKTLMLGKIEVGGEGDDRG